MRGDTLLVMDDRTVTVSIFVIPDKFVESIDSLLGSLYLVHVHQNDSDDPSLKYSKFEKALFDSAMISPLKDLNLPWPAIERSLLRNGAWVGVTTLDEAKLRSLFPTYYKI